jgi:hypothetical protein
MQRASRRIGGWHSQPIRHNVPLTDLAGNAYLHLDLPQSAELPIALGYPKATTPRRTAAQGAGRRTKLPWDSEIAPLQYRHFVKQTVIAGDVMS